MNPNLEYDKNKIKIIVGILIWWNDLNKINIILENTFEMQTNDAAYIMLPTIT